MAGPTIWLDSLLLRKGSRIGVQVGECCASSHNNDEGGTLHYTAERLSVAARRGKTLLAHHILALNLPPSPLPPLPSVTPLLVIRCGWCVCACVWVFVCLGNVSCFLAYLHQALEPEQLGAFLKLGGGVMEPTWLPPPELKMSGIQGEVRRRQLRRWHCVVCSFWWFLCHASAI